VRRRGSDRYKSCYGRSGIVIENPDRQLSYYGRQGDVAFPSAMPEVGALSVPCWQKPVTADVRSGSIRFAPQSIHPRIMRHQEYTWFRLGESAFLPNVHEGGETHRATPAPVRRADDRQRVLCLFTNVCYLAFAERLRQSNIAPRNTADRRGGSEWARMVRTQSASPRR
jgi:hypothetical protein